jgi:hypothetical protein
MQEETLHTQQKAPKTSRITLTSTGAKLILLAQARPDGSGTTYVATTDLTTKKTTRGMTKNHATFDAAKAEIFKMAVAAEKLAWARPERKGFAAKPDAFNTLPAAKQKPKAK